MWRESIECWHGRERCSDIEEIRRRPTEIEDEREHLADDDSDRLEDLLKEEHKLENRLADLEDRMAENEAGVAERATAQTDITRTPRLPDSDAEGLNRDQRQAPE